MDVYRQLAEVTARFEEAKVELAATQAREAAANEMLGELMADRGQLTAELRQCKAELLQRKADLRQCNADLMECRETGSRLRAKVSILEQQLGSSAGSTQDAEVPGGPQEVGGAAAAAAAQPGETAAALPAGGQELAAEFEGEQASVGAWRTGGPSCPQAQVQRLRTETVCTVDGSRMH